MPLNLLIITPIYAALLAIMFVVLSIRVIRLRRKLKIGIGTGAGLVDSDPEQGKYKRELILRAIRVHGNFAEYIPFALLLMVLMELTHAPVWCLHIAGTALLLGRISHAYGVSRVNEVFKYRVFGTATTFTTLLCMAGFLLLAPLFR